MYKVELTQARSASVPTATRTPAPTATPTPQMPYLDPDPATVSFTTDGSVWHGFTLNTNEQIKVVVNPGNTPLNLEMGNRAYGTDYCPSAQDKEMTVGNGGRVYLAGCLDGTGIIELRRSYGGALLRTYRFDIGSGNAPTPTFTPTPTATHTPMPAQTVTAWLSPNPESVDFTDDPDKWHEFTPHVHSGVPVYLSISMKGEKDLIEYSTKNRGSAKCRDREYVPIRDADKFYLAACDEGTATVELLTGVNNIIRTYHIPIGDTTRRTDTPTATPTFTPTATTVTTGATPMHTATATHTPTGTTSTPTATPTPECPSGTSGGNAVGLSTCPAPVLPTSTPTPTLDIKVGLRVVTPSISFDDYKWKILNHIDVRLTDFPSGFKRSDYEYRIIATEGAGIQVLKTSSEICTWDASGSSWPSESRWTSTNYAVGLVRCGLGDSNTKLRVELRKTNAPANVDDDSYTLTVKPPWHIHDERVTFAYADPLILNYVALQATIDQYKSATRKGVKLWNDIRPRDFVFSEEQAVTYSTDVMVKGFETITSNFEDLCYPNNPPGTHTLALACMIPARGASSVYPHFGGMAIYFEQPPTSPTSVAASWNFRWTNN